MGFKHLHWIIFLSLSLSYGGLRAAHLVGGEISYKCLGNNDYEISMIIYRDGLSSGAGFDPQAVISIYNSSNLLVANLSVNLLSMLNLPVTAPNNCTSLPNNVATEKGVYKDTVNLPPIPGGYVITHQRCCRNNTITNISNTTSQWGSTYTTRIPSMDNCNSSPKFVGDPPVVLCLNQQVSLDLSASDIDGDSLYYELCDVLHGGSNAPGNVMPNPAAPPPYTNVPFISGYSTQYPIASSPPFSIDPATGELSGKPTQVGQYVFAICVSEYRNGIKLSTTRRDFQFNVSNACKIILSRIQTPDGSNLMFDTPAEAQANPVYTCKGKYVHFNTSSQFANSYLWDFGDSLSLSDTSNLPNPAYLYADTGSYMIMHVAEPHTDCADTSYALYNIFDSVRVEFSFTGDPCFNNHSFNFQVSGRFSKHAEFQWDFGGATHIGTTSNQMEPKNISWNQPGTYVVGLQINDFGCSASYYDTVHLYPNPVISETVEPVTACIPHEVHFTDQSEAVGRLQHYWFFGDGGMSNEKDPTHVYTKPGTYTVEHIIKSLESCKDSAYARYTNVIQINPVPHSELKYSSKEQSIYQPNFSIENVSSNYSYSITWLPDGRQIENMRQEHIVLSDTGNHQIIHVSYNEYGCADTLIDTLRVEAPFQVYMPTAFTPDGDGLNDEYYFTVTDASHVSLEIYNRWGEVVYSNTGMDEFWNGHYQNSGKKVPPGIYSYVLIIHVKSGGYEHIEKGSFNLLR